MFYCLHFLNSKLNTFWKMEGKNVSFFFSFPIVPVRWYGIVESCGHSEKDFYRRLQKCMDMVSNVSGNTEHSQKDPTTQSFLQMYAVVDNPSCSEERIWKAPLDIHSFRVFVCLFLFLTFLLFFLNPDCFMTKGSCVLLLQGKIIVAKRCFAFITERLSEVKFDFLKVALSSPGFSNSKVHSYLSDHTLC